MTEKQKTYADDLRKIVKSSTIKTIENEMMLKKMKLDVEKIKKSALLFIDESLTDSWLLAKSSSIKFHFNASEIMQIALHTVYQKTNSEAAIASYKKRLGV